MRELTFSFSFLNWFIDQKRNRTDERKIGRGQTRRNKNSEYFFSLTFYFCLRFFRLRVFFGNLLSVRQS